MPLLTMELAGDRQPCYGKIKTGMSLLPGRNQDRDVSPTEPNALIYETPSIKCGIGTGMSLLPGMRKLNYANPSGGDAPAGANRNPRI